ncbi:MAG: redoxin family protein [Gammaproteobacteria bacterium]|nr:redoxin family protein [Acidobacteriota bacterium]NIP64383.1 redoxin family protein [Gammaproteobacteria bacterium]NIQ26789.1 redoxin family protein [Gammaproteobacteria bacterium]NIR19843.1 redoxin family protein [Gammaproteobacteria bacterium]NIT09965.1 redoxin family protein [Acidobacteriota bacterium]
MIEAVNIGPLLVPTWPAAVILALLIAVLATNRLVPRAQLDRSLLRGVAEGTAWVGILGARVGYVAANWGAFYAEPWTALYLWQPGYSAYAGVVTGACYAIWRIARRRESNRWRYLEALCKGYAVGTAALAIMIVGLHAFAPSTLIGRGDRVPDFVLEGLDGSRVRLSDLAGRAVVLNFWATWCPPCRREMPLLDAVHAEYARRGLSVVGVAVGESQTVVGPFVHRLGVRYPIWIEPVAPEPAGDSTRALHDRFAGAGLPTTIFIDRDHVVRNVYVGEFNRAFLLEQVQDLL